MRSRNRWTGRQKWVPGGAVAALLLGIASPSSGVLAEETDQSGWRQGVSRWTGNGYAMPSTASPPAAAVPLTTPSKSVISETPYTIPVDPTVLPSTGGMTVSGPASHSNPYFRLPPADEVTSLELVSPSDVQRSDATDDLVLPRVPIEPPLEGNIPLAQPMPIERLEIDEPSLPSPAEIAPHPKAQKGSSDVGHQEEPEQIPPGDLDLPVPESIAEQIDGELVVEPAPLESEVIRWYQYPQYWMRGWDSHAEFGLDGSSGNASTLAIQTGLETKRQTDLYTLALDVDYRQASNRGTTTEDNGRFNLDYDRILLESSWAAFSKYGMEWDEFKAFDLRVWGNAGVAYHWVRTDDANLVTRFGAGASKEIGAPDDAWIPEAVFAAEGQRQLTSRQKVRGKVEYFPAWEDFGNFRLVSDLAWEILLDGSENLSLRLSATDRYDSTPQGAKKNDLYYSLLLLYKF